MLEMPHLLRLYQFQPNKVNRKTVGAVSSVLLSITDQYARPSRACGVPGIGAGSWTLVSTAGPDFGIVKRMGR